jgi:hypothetical protein
MKQNKILNKYNGDRISVLQEEKRCGDGWLFAQRDKRG